MNSRRKAVLLAQPFSLGYAYSEETLRDLRNLLDLDEPAPPLDSAPSSNAEMILGGWGMPRLDRTILAKYPHLRIVFYAAGSSRQFMTTEAWDRGIRVVTAAQINARPVAEFTVAQIVLSLKQAFAQAAESRRRQTLERTPLPLPGAYGSTVGLVSLGEIGRQVAQRLAQFDVRVIAHDPLSPLTWPPPSASSWFR